MKQGWEIKRLDEVCTFINGKAYNKTELLESGKYPVLRVGNFFTNNHWYYSDLELPQDKYCDNGDLLYAWSASFGPRIWEGDKVIYHYHIWKVIPDEKLITKEFLYLLLDWDTEKIKKDQGTGTTMMHVGKGSMDARVVPIPPLPEQQRIVAILDEAFSAISMAKTNAEQNLKNAKELFESYLQGVFENKGDDWECKKLKELYQIGSSKRVLKSQWKTEGIPFYRGREITKLAANGFVDNELYISEEHYAELLQKTGVPKAGDIVMTAIGTIGNTHIVRDFDKFYFKDASVLWLKRVLDTSSEFTKYFLKSSLFFNQLDKGNGATVDTLTIDKLQNIELFIPTLKGQRNIVQKLDVLSTETKKLETIYQQKINDLEELKKSVLQKAFSGELKTEKVLV